MTRNQKVTEIYTTEASDRYEIFTYSVSLKNRLKDYADRHPDLCRIEDDDGQGGVRFSIDKHRFGFRITEPYSAERRKQISEMAKGEGIQDRV